MPYTDHPDPCEQRGWRWTHGDLGISDLRQRIFEFPRRLGQPLELDESGQALQLLPFNDDFSGENLNLQRWRVESRQYSQSYVQSEMDTVGCELRHSDGLRYTYPRAFHSQAYIHRAPVDNSVERITSSISLIGVSIRKGFSRGRMRSTCITVRR